MTAAQIYCTVDELIHDLGMQGDDGMLFSRIQAASSFIQRRIGQFIPVTETREFQGNGSSTQQIDLLLAITSVTNNTTPVTTYDLYPLSRYWADGHYSRIESDYASWDVVSITGKWGKYNHFEELGETVSQVASSTDTLVVADGSKISPGMVLLIETEQELVTGWGAVTLATSQTNGAVTESDEEITVDNGGEFHAGEVIQISTEDCSIRAVRGNVLVTARGWNGTSKASHATDSPISVYRTVKVTRGVNGTTAAAHASKAAYRYLAPEDVNWLARQIAGLMVKKAQSGFSGKIGNAELGETFYFNEFPGQIKEIARNYRVVSV